MAQGLVIPKMTGVAAGGRVALTIEESPGSSRLVAGSAPRERVYVIHDKEVLSLLRQAQIEPPQREGEMLNLAEVDRKLAACGGSVSARIAAKSWMRALGILPSGLLR
jgi:hypothetical protein